MAAVTHISFLLFFVFFAVTVGAHVAEFDDYWKSRAEEARNTSIDAYNPDPYEVNNNLNMKVEE